MYSSVGWIGLGDMGKPLATHVCRAAQNKAQFFLWNRTKSKAESFAAEECSSIVCDSAAHLGQLAELVFLCLPTSKETAEICAKIQSGDSLIQAIVGAV